MPKMTTEAQDYRMDGNESCGGTGCSTGFEDNDNVKPITTDTGDRISSAIL